MAKRKASWKAVRTERPTPQINRRHFIYTSALAAGTLAAGLPGCMTRPNYKSPNEKLNIAGVGTNGRAADDLEGVSSENIVALCDVDAHSLAAALKRYPGARPYSDYRVMIEKEEKSMDAVVVGTPDHHHAPAAIRAIRAGKHVYCEKPLTHTIWEARQLTLAARKYRVATQMGNQGHAGGGIRDLCEMIWAGAIGQVREVHCWTDRAKGWWTQGVLRPPGSDPIPPHLDWDKWLGPAPGRPYLIFGRRSSRRPPTNMFIIHRPGAVGGTSAAVPWATWPATSWIVRNGRCILARPRRWNWFPPPSACRKCRPSKRSFATNFPPAANAALFADLV